MYLNRVRNHDFLIHPGETSKRDPMILRDECIELFNILYFLIIGEDIVFYE